jgi:hypothetical protein
MTRVYGNKFKLVLVVLDNLLRIAHESEERE